jgi:nucleoside-diphosphate-sugar epimerase
MWSLPARRLYRREAAWIMCRSMLKRCNVGTGHSVRLVDLVAALNAISGTDLEPDFQPARAGDIHDSLASLSRISHVLGYQPLVSFRDGLKRPVEASVPSVLP